MTTPAMPRCSCGCGERLTPGEVDAGHELMTAGLSPEWLASTCLTEHRRRLAKQKAVDGEAVSVAKGLVPKPRRSLVEKPGTCDKCERKRLVRRYYIGPDESLLLCRRCVP